MTPSMSLCSHRDLREVTVTPLRIRPHRARDDINDQRDREESAEPIDENDPIENTDKNEPAEPIDRIDPAEPIERIEPLDPIDNREFSDQSDQRDREASIGRVSQCLLGQATGSLARTTSRNFAPNPQLLGERRQRLGRPLLGLLHDRGVNLHRSARVCMPHSLRYLDR